MHFRRVAATLTAATLWTGASAILGLDLGGILPILDGGLNLDLLQPGALITLGLNADLLTGDSECHSRSIPVALSLILSSS